MIKFLKKKKLVGLLTVAGIGTAVGVTLWSWGNIEDMVATNRKLEIEKNWNKFNKYDKDGWVDPSGVF